MIQLKHSQLIFVVFLVFVMSLGTTVVGAQPIASSDLERIFSMESAELSACEVAAGLETQSIDEGAAPVPTLFYSIPLDWLQEGTNHVLVRILVGGDRYLEERFPVQKSAVMESKALQRSQILEGHKKAGPVEPFAEELNSNAVFELLAERTDLRSELLRFADEEAQALSFEVLVNESSLIYQDWIEFAAESEQRLAEDGLPTAITAVAQLFTAFDPPDSPLIFSICGNGICDAPQVRQGPGASLVEEDCETCPEDCGGPCSICGNGFCGALETCSSCPSDCGACPICPEDLGTEVRIQNLSSTDIYTDCFNAWPGTTNYTYTRYDNKRYTVQRTRQCDGTIIETPVSGSTVYYSSYCYRYRGGYCPYSYGFVSPVCF